MHTNPCWRAKRNITIEGKVNRVTETDPLFVGKEITETTVPICNLGNVRISPSIVFWV